MSLQQAITEFRSQFRGEVLEPRAPGYDEAQSLYCDDRSQAEADRQVRRRRRCDSRRADGEGQRLRVSNRGVGHNAAIGSAGSPQTGRRTGCSDRENPLVMSISRTLNRH